LGELAIASALASSFLLSLALSWASYIAGRRFGIVGRDVHKSWESYAVRIGGVSLISAPLVSMALHPSRDALVFLLVTIASGLVGFIDDLRTLAPLRKVLLAIAPGLVHLLAGLYEPRLYIPMLGEVSARILYIFMVPAAYTVALNAANMMDTHNGILGGSVVVVLATLSPVLVSRSLDAMASSIFIASMVGSLAGFLLLNIYPARIFAGNVGSFILGSWIAFTGIYGRSEFLLILALFPMIINGFSIITSIGGLKEKSAIKIRPVIVEGGVIRANRDPRAPITIAHLASASSRKGVRETELVIGTWILFYVASIAALLLYTTLY